MTPEGDDAPHPGGHTHHTAGEADAAQSRADVVPHADAAPADALAHGQLQEEERDADEDQQDEIGHQVRTCGSRARQRQVEKKQTKPDPTL